MHQRSDKTRKQAYREYLKSDHWKQLKTKKRKKTCAMCCLEFEQMDVHHLIYRNWYDCVTTDIRKVCRECHIAAHVLIDVGRIKPRRDDHLSIFAATVAAVKMARFGSNGLGADEIERMETAPPARQDTAQERNKVIGSVRFMLNFKPFRPFGIKLTDGRVFEIKVPEETTIYQIKQHELVVLSKKRTRKKIDFLVVRPSRIESIIPLSATLTLLAA